MLPWQLALVAFACVFGGALIGMGIRAGLPAPHLTPETRTAIQTGMAVIATLSGLVLGLLVASSKSAFDAEDTEIKEVSAKLILLDRTLARYGPESGPARAMLKQYFARRIEDLWPEQVQRPARVLAVATTRPGLEHIDDLVSELTPATDAQRRLRSRALTLTGDLEQTRLLMIERATTSHIPKPFLVSLYFWVGALFVSIGLFAPRNATVIVAMLVCAVSLAAAIFLVLEMDMPLGGLIRISSAPAIHALSEMGR